jgi:hypothetical protein
VFSIEDIINLAVQIEDMGKELLQGALADQTFSLKDVDLSELYQIEDLLNRPLNLKTTRFYFTKCLGLLSERKKPRIT